MRNNDIIPKFQLIMKHLLSTQRKEHSTLNSRNFIIKICLELSLLGKLEQSWTHLMNSCKKLNLVI